MIRPTWRDPVRRRRSKAMPAADERLVVAISSGGDAAVDLRDLTAFANAMVAKARARAARSVAS